MSELKHTPGPWVFRKDSVMMYQVGIFPEKSIVPIGIVYGSIDDVENGANVRLIGAAPELLDALQDAVNWLSKLEDWSGVGDPDIEKYKSAIAKATGEQQ